MESPDRNELTMRKGLFCSLDADGGRGAGACAMPAQSNERAASPVSQISGRLVSHSACVDRPLADA